MYYCLAGVSGLPQCLTFECSPGPGVSGGLLLLVLIWVDYVETEEQVFKDLFYLGACVCPVCLYVCCYPQRAEVLGPWSWGHSHL